MSRLPFEQQLFLIIQAVGLAALIARVAATGLFRTYRYFFAYLILSLIQAIVLPFLPLSSRIYLKVWLISEGMAMSVYALVVLETYTLILRDIPGIRSAANQYLRTAVPIAVAVSLLLLAVERTPKKQFSLYFVVCERAFISTLLLFVLFSLAFLKYYPVPLNRNIMNYSIGFAVYLLTKSLALFIVILKYPILGRVLNSTLIATAAACPLFWLFTLSPRGEAKTVAPAQDWSPENEDRMLNGLRAIHENLTRTVKK